MERSCNEGGDRGVKGQLMLAFLRERAAGDLGGFWPEWGAQDLASEGEEGV